MKSIALAAAISLAATSAFAGTLADPVVEPIIVEPEGSSAGSSGSGVLPLLLLVLVGAAIAAKD